MAISHDIKDDSFRVEILECAKLLNLPNDDYTKELFNQVPLEYYYVQEVKDESIIVKGGCISTVLAEKCIDIDDASELVTEVLSEIKDLDIILSNNFVYFQETVITRDLIELEEPLFPKKIQLKDNFITYPVPTIKSLIPNYTFTEIPEPFLEKDMRTYTIKDLCPLYHEAMADEIIIAESLLKEQEIEQKDETIFIEGFKFEDKYFEEPLLPIKSIVCKKQQQDIPNSISKVVPLFNEEIELILQNDGENSVIEESGVKAPLEIINNWEQVNNIINDLEETLSDSSGENEMIFDIPSSREMYQLEPVLIPVKNEPLEMDRIKRRKKGIPDDDVEEDVTVADSIITVINHIVPENAILTQIKQDVDEEIQKDFDNMIRVEPFDQWQSIIMMQSMDEVGELKFKVPSLPHPVTYIKKSSSDNEVPTRLSDLVVKSNSSERDFHILAPFSGMKTLELELRWNPIKKFNILEIDKIVDVLDSPHDNLTEIIQEEYNCFDSNNLLDLIDFRITSENDEIPLKSRKEDKKLNQLEKKKSTAVESDNDNYISYSRMEANESVDIQQLKAPDKSWDRKKNPSKPNESVDIQQLKAPDKKWNRKKYPSNPNESVDIQQLRAPDKNWDRKKKLSKLNESVDIQQLKTPDKNWDRKKKSSKQNESVDIQQLNLLKAPDKNWDRKKKLSKQNDIQQLLRKPTVGRSRNVEKPMPDVMKWIREGNEEEDIPSPDSIPNLSGQDRVTQWLSSCNYNDYNEDLKNKNDDNNIEIIDLTQDTDLPSPKNNEIIDLTQNTDLSTPEHSAVDNLFVEISPYFKNNLKSSVKQNLFNTTNSFSAARSVDDFLVLRGKLSPGKRRETGLNNNESTSEVPNIASTPSRSTKISNNNPLIASSSGSHVNKNAPLLNKNSFIAIGKAILEQLPIPAVPHKYIISARMFPNRGLLTALRNKDCKVELIERDFEYMRPFLSEGESDAIHVDVDFIIDERTGVIFYPLNVLAQDQSVPKLVQTILRLHLKYSNLYLILETYTWNNRPLSSNTEYTITTYPFTLPTLRAISELKLILMCCNCDAKIMFSLCEEMSAKLLRMIGNSCGTKCDKEGATRIGDHGWRNHEEWEARNWMTTEESLHERFLSCFTPLINPFTAQIILTATTLLQLFQMTHSERCALVGGWIDEARLEKFDEIIHEILLSNSNIK